MNLYGLFILDVNVKYIVFCILYRHINVPMACKELIKIYSSAIIVSRQSSSSLWSLVSLGNMFPFGNKMQLK